MLQQRGRFRHSLEPIGCGLLSLGAGEFIAAIGGTAVWPLAVRAQQSGPIPSSVYFGPMQMPRLRASGEVLEVDSLRPLDCAPSSKAMFRLYDSLNQTSCLRPASPAPRSEAEASRQ